jgi:hypothetical protein
LQAEATDLIVAIRWQIFGRGSWIFSCGNGAIAGRRHNIRDELRSELRAQIGGLRDEVRGEIEGIINNKNNARLDNYLRDM